MEKDKIKQGKKNRQAGARFERKVRKDLESKGWIVDRWSNNVELPKEKPNPWYNPEIECTVNVSKEESDRLKELEILKYKGKLIPAKSRFGLRTTGFPDFIAFKRWMHYDDLKFETFDGTDWGPWSIIGIEVKSNGYLTKEEKRKIDWLISNNIFSKILIASKGKKRGEIEYSEIKRKI